MQITLQVMNGLKNYTVVTGEGELAALIQREREALRPDECINIDTVKIHRNGWLVQGNRWIQNIFSGIDTGSQTPKY